MAEGTRNHPTAVAPAHVDYETFARVAPRALSIAVVGGAGYVGAVTAVGLAHMGHRVTAVDINRERVAQFARGEMQFHEPQLSELLTSALQAGRIRFVHTDDLSDVLAGAGIVFIAVNTPRRDDGEADLSDVIQVASDLGRRWAKYAVIALKSTAPVGSHVTIRRVLEQFRLRDGSDYDLVANPEFLREGSALYDFFFPDRVVIGGQRPGAMAAVRELFEPLRVPILETTIENAQMIKYAANAFLAMRISFINEIGNICERVGADVEVVAHGLGYDKRIGDSYLRAGIGFSGPCLPKDLEGLIRLAEDAGYEPFFLKAILEKNEHQRRQILGKVYAMLGGYLYGRCIAVLGLTFKPGTDDVRDSASVRIVDHLVRRGADVRVYDPMAGDVENIRGQVVRDAYEAADQADLLLILTAWNEFKLLDFVELRRKMRVPRIVDGANALNPSAVRDLGFVYLGVGRK